LKYEFVGNLHMHTPFSDGHGTHSQIATAAIQAGLDFAVVTDHNIWIDDLDGYRYKGDRRVLLLVGEEVHDQQRDPQKNHLLVYETRSGMSRYSDDPQRLIDAVRSSGGYAFLAHPTDPAAPLFSEPDISWVDWQVEGFVGLEIWNFMSEFKGLLSSRLHALFYAYFPDLIAHAPYPQTIAHWNRLHQAGVPAIGIGGSDAHALPATMGPLKRTLFPYEYLFRMVNTHILSDQPLTGDPEVDRRRIFHNLTRGRCFIGYDHPASTRGFRFTAHSDQGISQMGDRTRAANGVTIQVRLPRPALLRLLHDGSWIREWMDRQTVTLTIKEPGAYRVEAYIPFKGRSRTWILSNPIFLTN
jgi:hypothetical protein